MNKSEFQLISIRHHMSNVWNLRRPLYWLVNKISQFIVESMMILPNVLGSITLNKSSSLPAGYLAATAHSYERES